jgi:hypothetical protein
MLQSVSASILQAHYRFDTTRFFPNKSTQLFGCQSCQLMMFLGAEAGDADFYDSIQSLPAYYESDKAEFDHAVRCIASHKPRALLEVGAGDGAFVRRFQHTASLSAKASELSPRSLSALRRSGIEIDTAADRYDFICSFQVLEHVADLRGMLSFFDSKLQPGGHLLLCVPNPECQLFRETFAYLDYPPHHVNRFTRGALQSIAHVLGYKCVDYWQESLRVEHFSTIAKARREKLLVHSRGRWLRRQIGAVVDSLVLPLTTSWHGEIGHSHSMVYRKSVDEGDE